MRLEKYICWRKKDKIQLKEKGDHIAVKRNGQKNSQTIKAFYDGNESDDSENDDENCNENVEAQGLQLQQKLTPKQVYT